MDRSRRRTLQCIHSALKRPQSYAGCYQTPSRYRSNAHRSRFSPTTPASSDTDERVRKGINLQARLPFSGTMIDIQIGNSPPFPPFYPAFLRDACECKKCVDPSSKQKNFQTTDIPDNIKATSVKILPDGAAEVVWENDIRGFEAGHKSVYSNTMLKSLSTALNQRRARFGLRKRENWDKKKITKELDFVDYEHYMETEEGLLRALNNLHAYGLLVLRGVPASEKAVEDIALRIGNLRDTLYGRTWDVRSVPQAKNVAYTAQYLGLHMDLLYMANPPGFQFLHCLQNTCEGGSSLFSDAVTAAGNLPEWAFQLLCRMQIAYHYKTNGEHYYYQHPVIETSHSNPKNKAIDYRHQIMQFVNYSPPFQANHVISPVTREDQSAFAPFFDALKIFAREVESDEALYEYRLQEGECVIFNNRRILHGRRQFDTTTGSRWLKGAYIDTDVFMSKYRVLSEKSDGPLQYMPPRPRKRDAETVSENLE